MTTHVIDLVVAADRRGRGLGCAVLTELAAEADANRRELRLNVWADNLPARRLYERSGFEYTTDPGAGHLGMRRPTQGSA